MSRKRAATTLFTLVLCLALIAPVGVAWAYFTSYATTKGSVPLSLGAKTEITEDFSNWTKSVTISNSSDSVPVFIRAKAFSGTIYPLLFEGASWDLGKEGFYYYADPVAPGSATSVLKVIIEGAPSDAQENDQFNVVVVYESTPVLYDSEGNPYADWSMTLDKGTFEGGEGR